MEIKVGERHEDTCIVPALGKPEGKQCRDDAEPEVKVSAERFSETDDERTFSAEGILIAVAIIVHN